MFSPLSLKLCVMAAMAPALTEAATQARVKLANQPPQTGQGSRLVNGRGSPNPHLTETSQLAPASLEPGPSDKPHLQTLRPQARDVIHNLASHLNGKTTNQPQSTTRTCNLVNIGVVKSLSGRYKPENYNKGSSGHSQVNGNLRTGGIHMNNTSSSKGGTSNAGNWAMSGGNTPGTRAGNMGYIVRATNTTTMAPPTTSTSRPSAAQGAPLPPALIPPVMDSHGGVVGNLSNVSQDDPVHLGLLGDSTTVETTGVVASTSGMSEVGVLTNVDLVAETTRRQREMARRAERALRRLRRLQSRNAVSHIQSQLNGFVDHQHKNLQSIAKSMKVPPATNMDLKTELLQSEDVKSLSTAALVNLVRRLQTSQAITLRQRLASQNQVPTESGSSVLKLDEELCIEMNRVSSTLQIGLHHLESSMDSDATESSSGGESCDEMDFDFDDEKLPKPPLSRRAEWRWAMDRAAVAARWTWLQAQVSDLEYRIRQQGDIYKQIRATKGAVTLGDPPPPEDLMARSRNTRQGRKLSPLEEKIANLERKNEMSPCNLSTLLSNVDKQSTRLTQQLGNVYSPATSPLVTGQVRTSNLVTPKTPSTPNGFVDPSGCHGTDITPESDLESVDLSHKRPRSEPPLGLNLDSPSQPVDSSCQAARCRPVRSYGKRRLLRTAGLHQLFRKAARLSSVKCCCYPPVVPCAMCGGRYNNTQTVESESAPLPERFSLLDASFHPVLSFPQDTPLQCHFETLLKSGDWQHKTPPKPMRSLAAEKRKAKNSGTGDQVRKYNKKLSKSTTAAMLSSAKIRCKYEQKQLSRSHSGSLPSTPKSGASDGGRLCRSSDFKLKKRKAALHAIDAIRKKHRALALPTRAGNRGRRTPSPIPSDILAGSLASSGSSSSLREQWEAMRRRRGESAFDINNIVIPYSMAASTRVERLKYKEIITPKWREIHDPLAEADVMRQGNPKSEAEGAGKILTDNLEVSDKATEPNKVTDDRDDKDVKENNTESLPVVCTVEEPLLEGPPSEMNPVKSDMTDVSEPSKSHEPVVKSTVDEGQSEKSVAIQSTSAKSGENQGKSEDLDHKNDQPEDVKSFSTRENEAKVLHSTEEQIQPASGLEVKASSAEGMAGLPKTPGRANGIIVQKDEDEDEETEDVSEEAIAARHMRCEVKEKKRFSSCSAIQKRSRGSRGEVGTITPDPLSPEARPDTTLATLSAVSASLDMPLAAAVPSPTLLTTLATPSLGPLGQLIDEQPGESRTRSESVSSSKNDETFPSRRRTTSGAGKIRSRSVSYSDELNRLDFTEETVAPWEPRTFPLNDSEYDSLFQEWVAPPPVIPQQIRAQFGNVDTPESSRPCSPLPSSSGSSVAEEDPDDPEWTVVSAEKPVVKTGIVLKLAKR